MTEQLDRIEEKLALALAANDMPTTQKLADIRTFITGANFPGYSGSSLGLP